MRMTAAVGWADIRVHAQQFTARWRGAKRERAEKDSFWNEFLEIFGIDRKQVARFEPVAKRYSTDSRGFIDMLWPGRILVEHKSAGADLAVAMKQALDYLPHMDANDVPRLIIVCDFDKFIVRDQSTGVGHIFALQELPDRLDLFGFLVGRDRGLASEPEVDVNLTATELLTTVHDGLQAVGYDDHQRRVLMTRLLFCLFADDAQIWPTGLFEDYVRLRTRPDGSDLGPQLAYLFEILDSPPAHRLGLTEEFAAFTYINGKLFAERLPMAHCNEMIRSTLLKACRFNWSKISPAIFGSMFQNVMEPIERRSLGAHYTTEKNILRTIGPLFLDDLEDGLARASDRDSLRAFQERLASLTFFDPACGCGNFLVIAYREVRRLELECLVRMRRAASAQLTPRGARRGRVAGEGQLGLDVTVESKVHVGQFYGIELEEFPCKIAETALHLVDHLANLDLSEAFGQYYARFPITEAASIINGNALRIEWSDVLDPVDCSFLFGNPPFVGMSIMSEAQDEDMEFVFGEYEGLGLRLGRLDYVAAWYARSFSYMKGTGCRAALVSTNSIVQGEQARSMGPLFARFQFKIDFAHRPFAWTSEAKGPANVHVVIVGFSGQSMPARQKMIYDYESLLGEPAHVPAANINVYLVDTTTWVIAKHQKPIVPVPKLTEGNRPEDGQGLILSDEDAQQLQSDDPIAAKYLRRLIGTRDTLNGKQRWCLWLVGATPSELAQSPFIRARLAIVRAARLNAVNNTRSEGRKRQLRAWADTPSRFVAIRQPSVPWLFVPRHSSNNRRIVPMAFMSPNESS